MAMDTERQGSTEAMSESEVQRTAQAMRDRPIPETWPREVKWNMVNHRIQGQGLCECEACIAYLASLEKYWPAEYQAEIDRKYWAERRRREA
jgi:hypothetical protein